MCIMLEIFPCRGGRVTLRLGDVLSHRLALVIVSVKAAGVVGIILHLMGVANEVCAIIHKLQYAGASRDGQCGIFKEVPVA